MTTLTINAIPETFTSSLPDGVVGDLSLVDKITRDNVKSIEIGEEGVYEENLDGEYIITLNDGSTIQFDGYTGLWDCHSYDRLKTEAQDELCDSLREHITEVMKDIE